MEQELATGLGERQIAEFVEDDEVHPGQVIGQACPAGHYGPQTPEPVDEVDDVVEPASGAATDAASGNGDGQVGLASAGTADQHGVALLGEEGAAGKIAHQRLVDRRALELEVVEVLCQRQLGSVVSWYRIERACFSLTSAVKQVSDNTLRLMLAA